VIDLPLLPPPAHVIFCMKQLIKTFSVEKSDAEHRPQQKPCCAAHAPYQYAIMLLRLSCLLLLEGPMGGMTALLHIRSATMQPCYAVRGQTYTDVDTTAAARH